MTRMKTWAASPYFTSLVTVALLVLMLGAGGVAKCRKSRHRGLCNGDANRVNPLTGLEHGRQCLVPAHAIAVVIGNPGQ